MSYVTIFLASLIGSAHCAGMCGGIAGLCSGSNKNLFFYHTGRLVSYSLFGALAGYLGQILNSSFPLHTIFTLSSVLAICSLVLVGFFSLKTSALTRIRKTNGFSIGLYSAFLPCGWLYSFILIAFALGSPIQGAICMAVFWLGTVPFLTGSAFLIRESAKISPKLQKVIVLSTCIIAVLLHLSSFPDPSGKASHSPLCNLEQSTQLSETIN